MYPSYYLLVESVEDRVPLATVIKCAHEPSVCACRHLHLEARGSFQQQLRTSSFFKHLHVSMAPHGSISMHPGTSVLIASAT